MRILLFSMIFMAFVVLMPFGSAHASCPNKEAPAINIKLTSNQIKYNFDQSKNSLKSHDIDTISPYDQSAHTEIGGLMSGEISVKTNVGFGWTSSRRTGETCFWYDDIDVSMHIDPTILVASEHPEGTCMHNSILEHEMKHIKVDRKVLKKYQGLLKSDIQRVVRKVDVVGPVSERSKEKARQKMMRIIEKTVSNRTERMYEERRRLQQAVDSLKEYERVAARCPS